MTTKDLQNTGALYWREQRLRETGFDPEQTREVALTTGDLHRLERLLERGCPPPTAVAILR